MSEPATSIDLDRKYTFAEYYQIIQTSETKYEFVDGKLIDIRAMAGGTLEHSGIAVNVIAELRMRLEGKPCRPYNSDLAIRAIQMARYRYPDITVFCEKPEFEEDDRKKIVALNPRVVIEILSPSTAGTDRGEKFGDYRAIESLQQYVLIAQDQPMVETYTRRDDGTWLIAYASGLDAIAKLHVIDVELPLRDVYAGVSFEDDARGKPGKPAAPVAKT